jgi:hypothetical protein
MKPMMIVFPCVFFEKKVDQRREDLRKVFNSITKLGFSGWLANSPGQKKVRERPGAKETREENKQLIELLLFYPLTFCGI